MSAPVQMHDALDYMAHHGRSFRFATRFMRPVHRDRIARVYAWCRYTDDLVDNSTLGMRETEARLDEWLAASRAAYRGEATGVTLLDDVFGDMRQHDVPFTYAEQLVEGVRMDLGTQDYATMRELETYTFRVASVVGLWLTRLYWVHDEHSLWCAARLGHAMQLTNIVRDVGADFANGRVYLPQDRLEAYGLDRAALMRGMSPWGELLPGFAPLVEELMQEAERAYADAWTAVARLPLDFRIAVAVAASVYRGIHSVVRANGGDTLRRRAYTSLPRKALLTVGCLCDPAIWRSGARAATEGAEIALRPLHYSR